MPHTPHESRSIPPAGVRGRRRVSNWLTAARNLAFPPRCLHCGVDLGEAGDIDRPGLDLPLCDDCFSALAPAHWISCRRCGAAALAGRPAPDSCGRCSRSTLAFDSVFALGPYQGELREALLRMKRPGSEPLAEVMAQLLYLRWGEELKELELDAVLAVPMYWGRRLFRGVNSPDILAERLARYLEAPLADRLLPRHHNTPPQKGLPPGKRYTNLKGAFRLRAGVDLARCRLLLVDDVLTTGATCGEIAAELKRAGASMVAIVVLARAEGAGLS